MKNEQGQEQQLISSLYDFIYIDAVRAKQFISQLLVSGVMTAYKEERASSDTMNAKLGMNKIFVAEGTNTAQDSEKFVREYDTSGIVPNNLLNLLDKHEFIKRDIQSAKISNLVLVSGEYRIFDISLIEKALPVLGKLSEDKSIPDGATELFKLLPRSLQVDVRDENGNFYWLALKKESLLIDVENIILSNGVVNRDKWNVLGILENLPTRSLKKGVQPHKFEDDKSPILKGIYESIQETIGKKETSYSITPVLIFRQITK